MKKYVCAALAAIAVLSGCAKEILSEPETSAEVSESGYLITLTAVRSEEDAPTRTVISPEDSKVINWSEGDEISVFDAAGKNCRFTLKKGAGTPVAVFEGTVTELAESYTALYPYQSKAELEAGNNGSLHYNIIENVPLITEQKAVEGSFDPEAAIMTARSESGSGRLQFRNLLGFIKLTPKSDCGQITFTPTEWPEGVPCGYCDVVLEENDSWIPRLGEYGRAESVSISGDIKAGKAYYIAVPVSGGSLSFPNGFSITFSTDEIDTFKRTDKTLQIKRNTVVNLGEVEGVPESYLKFTADAEQGFYFFNGDQENFEYSVGDGEWSTLTSATVYFGGDKGDLKLRGKSDVGTWSTKRDCPGRFRFEKTDVKVNCAGDIRTLIDWENYKTVDTGKAVFKELFLDCKVLVSAPALPLNKLAQNCCYQMFANCSSLEKAPDLPATELADGCYNMMFYGCTSLYSLPELPAPAVPQYAYSAMFQNCSKIYYAPDLPALQVSSNGYSTMFGGCTSLEGMPEIAATSIGDYAMASMFSGCTNLSKTTALPDVAPSRGCYSGMFKGCTALKVAPEITAKETAAWCYDNMFAGSGIEKAPDLPAESVADYAYKSMFEGCQSLTEMPEIAATAVGLNGMTFMFKSCSNLKTATDLKITDFTGTYNCAQMFVDCTSLESAPALPATDLAEHCYSCMFIRCKSLEEAPELPATVLKNFCYEQMFKECINLKTVPKLPAETLADNCYTQMFQGCTSLTEAPQLPAMKMAVYCYSSMFSGCSALASAPVLKFTEVAANCCSSMFENCKSLTEAPQLPAEKMADGCYSYMFEGCSALSSAPALKLTETAYICCYRMFKGCEVLENVILDVKDVNSEWPFKNWLEGTAANGKLHIRSGLNETTKSYLNLPSGWTFVEDITD